MKRFRRSISLILAWVMLLGLLPGLPPAAEVRENSVLRMHAIDRWRTANRVKPLRVHASIELRDCTPDGSFLEFTVYESVSLTYGTADSDTMWFGTPHRMIWDGDALASDSYTEADLWSFATEIDGTEDDAELWEPESDAEDDGISLSGVKSYDPAEAVAYANKYAKSYNPKYSDYNSIGGDTRKIKLLVTLKTKEEQMLAAAVETVNLTEDEQNLSRRVFVSYDGSYLVAKVEVAAVGIDGNDRTGGALSELVSAKPTITKQWSPWLTAEELAEKGVDPDDADVETKTQYRYQDSSRSTTTRTSASSTPDSISGWKHTGTTWDWGALSGWSDSAISSTSDRAVETRQVQVSAAYTEYRYGRWTDGSHVHFCPQVGKSYYGGTWAKKYTSWSRSAVSKSTASTYYCGYSGHTHINPDHTSGSTAYWYSYTVGGKKYYWQETRTIPAVYKTQYRYQDKVYTHSYEKWSEGTPSAWSDQVYTAYETTNSRRTVETRPMYRYVTNDTTVTDLESTAVERTVTGQLAGTNPDLTGKRATVLVYKETNSDPTEPQLEYVGQTVLTENNEFSVTFRTKEEPSAATGSFIVALALQGSSNVVNVDKIASPAAQYTVHFYNHDGSLLSEQSVAEGRAAEVPESPARTGYRFVCWSTDPTDIRQDLEITPVYVPEQYSVVFADHENAEITLDTQYTYGDALLTPETPACEGKTFAGWQVVSNRTGETLALLTPGAEGTHTYTAPITVTDSTIIRAIAVKPEQNTSEIVQVEFWHMDEAEDFAVDDTVEIGTYNVVAQPGKTVTLADAIHLARYLIGLETEL